MSSYEEQELQEKISELATYIGLGPVLHFSFADSTAVTGLMEKLVSTALTNPAPSARAAAFECLPKIAALHYDILPPFFPHIGQPWCEALKKENIDEIRLAIVEFWSVICDVESERHLAIKPHNNFITAAAPHLVPILFDIQVEIIQNQADEEELLGGEFGSDDEDDEAADIYNVGAAVLTLLGTIAVLLKDAVAAILIPIMAQHLQSTNWLHRHAAVMTFGGVIQSGAVNHLIPEFLPSLAKDLRSPHPKLRDAASWTMRRTTQNLPAAALPSLPAILPALIESLSDKYSISVTSCNTLFNLAAAKALTTNEACDAVVQALMQATERDGENAAAFKTACLDALAEVLKQSPDSYIPTATNILQLVLNQLSSALSSLASVADEASAFAFIGGLCIVVSGLLLRLGPNAAPFADTIFDLTCPKLMACSVIEDSAARTEAFTCLRTLVEVGGAGTVKYLPGIFTALLQTIPSKVGLIGFADSFSIVTALAHAVKGELQPFSQQLVVALLESLKSSELDFELRSQAIVCIGDVALALETAFQPFYDMVMATLKSASEACIDLMGADPNLSLDEEAIENRNWLTRGVCSAYAGVIAAVSKDPTLNLLAIPHLPIISSLIGRVASSPEVDIEVSVSIVSLIRSLLNGPVPQAVSVGRTAEIPPTFKAALALTPKILEDVASIGATHTTNALEAKELISKALPVLPG